MIKIMKNNSNNLSQKATKFRQKDALIRDPNIKDISAMKNGFINRDNKTMLINNCLKYRNIFDRIT